jgi:FkbM family methyltransferase
MIKNILQKFFYFFGYEVKKKYNKNQQFNDILRKKINDAPVILDIGANRGQSIDRFSKIFKNPKIHAFEPLTSEFKYLKKIYSNQKNIILNNSAAGDKEEIKKINVTAKSDTSSFNNIMPGTKWLKIRSEQNNTAQNNYVINQEDVKIIKLDDYVSQSHIDEIDIVKIDTQGYEEKILEGLVETIKKNKIKVIITEIIFDNNYSKYLSFYQLEKHLIPNGFRLVGVDFANKDLFSGIGFAVDAMYFNTKKIDCSK